MQSRVANRVSPALLIAVAPLVFGCTPGRPYYPAVPHRASARGIDAEIVEVRRMYGFKVVLKIRGARDARVTRALLAPAVATPCREGVRDIGFVVDDKPQWLRPVALDGDHRVALAFPHGASEELLEASPVIDLVVPSESSEGETCVRLPLSGKAAELAWKRPLDWSADWGLRWVYPAHPVGSVDNGWSLDLGIGRWLGPIRARVEFGAGTANCTGYCPPGPTGEQGFGVFPVRGAVDGYVFETRGFGFAAELGYELFPAVRRNPDDTRRWETNHGPRAAVRFDLTQAPPPGWPGGGRQSAFGLELSLSRWSSPGDADPALVWGFGVVNYFGF